MSDFLARAVRRGAGVSDRVRAPRAAGAVTALDGLEIAADRWAPPTSGGAPPGELARSPATRSAAPKASPAHSAPPAPPARQPAPAMPPAPPPAKSGDRASSPLGAAPAGRGGPAAVRAASARSSRAPGSHWPEAEGATELPAPRAPGDRAARSGQTPRTDREPHPRPPRSPGPPSASPERDEGSPGRASTGRPEASPTGTTAAAPPPLRDRSPARGRTGRPDGDGRWTEPRTTTPADGNGRPAAPRPAPRASARRPSPARPPAGERDAAANGRDRASTLPDHRDPPDAESPERGREAPAPAEAVVGDPTGARIEVRIDRVELRGEEPAGGGSRHPAGDARPPGGFDDYAALRSYR